jgi:hypothetical protein
MGLKQIWLSSIVSISLLCAAAASPAAARAIAFDPAACSQHSIVGGIRHQPTTADIESAKSLCGVLSPVDTLPAYGAAIDELNRELQDEGPRN